MADRSQTPPGPPRARQAPAMPPADAPAIPPLQFPPARRIETPMSTGTIICEICITR